MSKKMFLQRMGMAHDKAAEKGFAGKFTDHMIGESKSFYHPQSAVLTPLDTVVVAKTGVKTIAQAEEVFTRYIDPNFTNWDTDTPSRTTSTSRVTVYEVNRDAAFEDMFIPPPDGNLNACYLTQAQIIKFCQRHKELLREDDLATLFPFEANGYYFVAGVGMGSNEQELSVSAYYIDDPTEWEAIHRFRAVLLS